MADTLAVWLDDVHVADLERRDRGLRLRHTAAAVERWPENSPVVSCSLPLSQRWRPATAFFRGVLPEGAALDALAARADVPASDSFALLARYGRDIAGALVLAGERPDSSRYALERYDDASLADEVSTLDLRPLGVHDDSELSIAGLQNKMLLVATPDGGWARPVHGHPSTHILKADNPTRPGLVAAEARCLALARRLGLTSVDAELVDVGAQQCLIVERFDRRVLGDGRIERVHQEDLTQATGREAKYESRRRGGPGYRDAATVLERYARDPTAELERLLRIATFTLAIGNADGHGKNLSFLHDTPTSVALAPLYDTVPTIMWHGLRTEAAMGLGGHFSLETCDRHDLVEEARSWPLARRAAEEVVADTLTALRDALGEGLIPEGDPLSRTLRDRVRNLLGGRIAGAAKRTYGR